MTALQERKNKNIAAITTVTLNGLLVTLLLFVSAWRAPNPPHPEYGIELNFGMDLVGGGDVQPTEPTGASDTPVNDEETEAASEPETSAQTEAVKELVSSEESPVIVKETPKEPTKEEKKTEVVVKKVDKPAVNEQAVYKPDASKASTTTKAGKDQSHGDDANKTGDKGNPQGSLNAKALYGKQGGGDGGAPSLDLAGFTWGEIPKFTAPENEQGGRLTFKIKVDRDGNVFFMQKEEGTVSPETERLFRTKIQNLSFVQIGENVPEETTGKITFIIRSN